MQAITNEERGKYSVKKKQILKWISRVYSTMLLFIVGILLYLNIINQEYVIKIRFDFICLVAFSSAFIIHFILLVLTQDLFVKWVMGIMIIPLPICSFVVFVDSGFPDWVGLVIGVVLSTIYSLTLFFSCKKTYRFIPIIAGSISYLPVFLFSCIIFSSTYIDSQTLNESVSPDGRLAIQVVKYIYESDTDVRVNVHSNWNQAIGIFCLKRTEEQLYYTYSNESFEINWISNDIVTVNQKTYTRISDFKLIESFETPTWNISSLS